MTSDPDPAVGRGGAADAVGLRHHERGPARRRSRAARSRDRVHQRGGPDLARQGQRARVGLLLRRRGAARADRSRARAPTASACCSRCSAPARSRSRSRAGGSASASGSGCCSSASTATLAPTTPSRSSGEAAVVTACGGCRAALPSRAQSGAAKPKMIGTRGEVISISADGGNVAIHAATKTTRPCDSGSVWTPASGKIVHFVDENCTQERRATGTSTALTLAGSRAAWADYDYGNHAYCIGPVTATIATPRRRATPASARRSPTTRTCTSSTRATAPSASSGARGCSATRAASPTTTGSYQDDVVLYTVTSKREEAGAPRSGNTDLLDVDAGRILLRVKKTLVVLDGSGKQVATLRGRPARARRS